DEIKSRTFSALHALAGKLRGVHSAGRNLSFFVSFGARRKNFPVMDAVFQELEGLICPIFGLMLFDPQVRESPRHGLTQRSSKCGDTTLLSTVAHFARPILLRRE